MKTNYLTTLLLTAVTVCFSLTNSGLSQTFPSTEGDVVGDGIIGEKAPALVVEKWFQLPPNQTEKKISDYKGKVLIMLLFQAEGKGSEMGLSKLKGLYDHYKPNSKVEFLLIQTPLDGQLNKRSPERLQEIAKNQGFEFPLGHYNFVRGFPGMVTPKGSYKNSHLPWFVVVDPEGIVRFNGVPMAIDVEFAKERIDEMLK